MRTTTDMWGHFVSDSKRRGRVVSQTEKEEEATACF
jgi:hypothetical protein